MNENKIVIKIGFVHDSELASEKVYALTWNSKFPNANRFLTDLELWINSDPDCTYEIVK